MTTSPLILVMLVVLGCQVGKEPGDLPPPQPPRFERNMMLRFHMRENFNLLRAIEKHLIRGRLDDARTLARAISEAPDEPGLAVWGAQAALVRDLAASLGQAPSIDEGCRREARLAVACAGCHASAGVMPDLGPPSSPPPDKPTTEARMARHLWATDRLWEAVVGGGDDLWIKGLDVLAATPLPFRQAVDDRAGLARQLQRLADQARKRRTTDTLVERGRIYGEILIVCATCHTSPVATTLPSER